MRRVLSRAFPLFDDDFDASVVGSAFGRFVVGDGVCFAFALGRDAFGSDALHDQILANRVSARLGKLHIGVVLADGIRIAFHYDFLVLGLLLQILCDSCELVLRKRQKSRFARNEEHLSRKCNHQAALISLDFGDVLERLQRGGKLLLREGARGLLGFQFLLACL